jgi:hypothetical protein
MTNPQKLVAIPAALAVGLAAFLIWRWRCRGR